MSNYTTEVRFICESICEECGKGFSSVDKILEVSAPKIFNFDFPIFDEAYRLPLEIKILRHYYTREISEETVGLWKLRLQDRLNIVMPYFNQLYNSELIKFDPLKDYENKTEKTIATNGGSNVKGDSWNEGRNENYNSGENNSDSRNLFSNTPQGGIDGLESLKYLTTAEKTTGTNKTLTNSQTAYHDTLNTNTNTTVNSTEKYIEEITGKHGGQSYSSMLKEFRDTFLNIDSMVIDSLSNLFFGLWE